MTKKSHSGRVRLRDVAAAAGVNTSIASRVLNEDPTLSARPDTRQRVRDAAIELGYTPNTFARGLRMQRTTSIGLVVPQVLDAANQELIVGAERRAAGSGYVVLLADAHDFSHGGDIHRRLVLERRVDGLLIAGSCSDRVIEDLEQRNFPYVYLNRQDDRGAPWVAADDRRGAALAVGHLLALGHSRIALLDSAYQDDAAVRRVQGYADAFREAGLASYDVVLRGAMTEEGGFHAAVSLLNADSRPTALVATGVSQAVGVLAALRARGASAPRDLSLVALSDAPIAAYLDPPLTAVRMPVREIAEVAVEKLIAVIEGGSVGDRALASPPELVLRGSTMQLDATP